MALPSGAQAHATGGATVEGLLNVSHVDDVRASHTTVSAYIETRSGASVQLVLGRGVRLPASGTWVHAGGRLDATHRLHVARGGVERSARRPTDDALRPSSRTSAATRSGVTGTRRLAVLLVNFRDRATQPYSTTTIRGRYFTDPDAIAARLADASYGSLALQGDVFGWYTIQYSWTVCNYASWGTSARALATAASVDLAAYDHVAMVFPNSACGGGLGSKPGRYSWVFGDTFHTGIALHELGHNLALEHSTSSSCTNNLGVRVTLSRSCAIREFGDLFSVMGSAAGGASFSAYDRERAGWFGPANVLVSNQAGTYTIDTSSAPSGGLQLLKLYRAWANDAYGARYLYVELRRPIGLDGSGAGSVLGGGADGVLVRTGTASGGKAALLDATPLTASYSDAELGVGRSITDPVSGITVAVAAQSATTAMITVARPTDTPPAAPTSLRVSASTPTSLTIAWNAATDNIGLMGGYELWRDGTRVATTRSLSYVDAGLQPGEAHAYQVLASDGFSSTASAMLQAVTPPSTPGTPVVTARTASSTGLAWSPAQAMSGIDAYQLWRLSGTTRTLLATVPPTVTPAHTLAGLATGISMLVYVVAIDNGRPSAPSGTVVASTDLVAPSAPAAPHVTSRATTAVSIAWSAATDTAPGAVTGYRVYRQDTSGNWLLARSVAAWQLSAQVTGLATGVWHTFTVTAVDGGSNESAQSAQVVTSTDMVGPTAPGGLTMSGRTTSSVTLSWGVSSDPSGIRGYTLYRAVGTSWVVVRATDALTRMATVDGLTTGVRYLFAVRAQDQPGNFGLSTYGYATPA